MWSLGPGARQAYLAAMDQVIMEDPPEPPATDLRGELLKAMREAIREATASNAQLAKGSHGEFADPTEASLDAVLKVLGLNIR